MIQRIKAYFIDWIILVSAVVVIALTLNQFENPPGYLKGILFFGLFFLYEPLTTSLLSGTIGHHLIGIRVRQKGDQSLNIPVFSAFIRFFVKIFLGWISFLTISSSEKKRAIHDMVSGSVVINYKSSP